MPKNPDSPKKPNTRNPRIHVTISEGHYSKLIKYCEKFNFATAQASALLLQNAIDEVYEKEELGGLEVLSATRIYYDAMFGRCTKDLVDFRKVASELNLPLEEIEARFEQFVGSENPYPKRRKQDCNKQEEECECES